mgnify:CR=1 FL=1
MQYSISDVKNPKEDDKRGFNYRTGLSSGVESRQSNFQLQYELSFDKINTSMSVGVESQNANFESYKQTFGRYEDEDNYRIYGAYFSTKTDISDKLNLQLAGRYDKYPAMGENSFSPRIALVYKPSQKHSTR